jgi:ER membrane protein complex subunit 6
MKMSSNRVKTRETKSGEIIAYSESAVRNNLINIEYVKTSLACEFSGS